MINLCRGCWLGRLKWGLFLARSHCLWSAKKEARIFWDRNFTTEHKKKREDNYYKHSREPVVKRVQPIQSNCMNFSYRTSNYKNYAWIFPYRISNHIIVLTNSIKAQHTIIKTEYTSAHAKVFTQREKEKKKKRNRPMWKSS